MVGSEELVVEDASAVLGGKTILRGVGLQLRKGELMALLGASGCGKTTLLRAIAGLSPLAAGTVWIAGRDVTRLSAQQRGIGVVFQHYALFPNLSALENVKFGLLAEGRADAEATRHARELLSLVELQAQAGALPGQLSGGQRQRVALARALARRPSLLLMDEPFSALDESFRVPLRRSFRRLQKELGQTCLVVTHDREEAFELADQVAVMFDGRIEQCSPPLELWKQPATRRVADFLGAFNRWTGSAPTGNGPRASGSWIAPIGALRLASAGDSAAEHWGLRAQVAAVYVGQQRVSVSLLCPGGDELVLWREHADTLPAVGDWLDLCVPHAALQHLPE
jgi:ABC-type Fe3+/spermidine/putrescine transport system ATPase subunit